MENTHLMTLLDVFWMALGTISFRTLAKQCMKTNDESNSTAGPHMSAIVTILVISSATI